MAVDEHGRPSFQALQHRSVKRSAIVYYAFDPLHLGRTDYRKKPLCERRAALTRLHFELPILLSHSLDGNAAEVDQVVRAAGLERVVAKRLGSRYEPGIRSRDWVKVKFSRR